MGRPRSSGIEELELDQVTRMFGDTVALEGFTLTIKGNEFVSFLGPSGSGKSTALNCLAGLHPLTSGEIRLDGRRIDTLPPERRGFAMVFQNYALFPHMSVRRNVAFGLRMRGLPNKDIERRVDQALDLVHLRHHGSKYPSQLSGGEQQRVAIARAIVCEPPLVLMDEPLSNLDAKLRLEMRTEIRRLHQELGLTTVYVTHDQQEALSLSDRMVILRHGRIEQIGTPEEIYQDPASSFVASFIGYRNIFDADVVQQSNGRVTVRVAGMELTGTADVERLGSRAVMCIRPEDLAVSDERSSAGSVNRLDLVVEVVEFGGREFMVQGISSSGLRLHLASTDVLRPGERITVVVPVDRVRVYPPEGED